MIIYKATNKINGNVYIGKTIGSFKSRISSHKYNALRHHQASYFYRAIRKYGWNNFQWNILCETDDEPKLTALEKFYIAGYRKIGKLYNMTDGGEGLSGWVPSEAYREKMRIKYTGTGNPRFGIKMNDETKRKIAIKATGRKHSEETKKKMLGRVPGNKGKPSVLCGSNNPMFGKHRYGAENPMFGRHHSEETRKKISEARSGKLVGENNPMFNRHHSDESKLKMSIMKKIRNNEKRIRQCPLAS